MGRGTKMVENHWFTETWNFFQKIVFLIFVFLRFWTLKFVPSMQRFCMPSDQQNSPFRDMSIRFLEKLFVNSEWSFHSIYEQHQAVALLVDVSSSRVVHL